MGMDKQMCIKSMQLLLLKNLELSDNMSSKAIEYTKDLFCHRILQQDWHTYDKEGKVVFVGRQRIQGFGSKACLVYKKCMIISTMFHSKAYTKATRTYDSFVELANDKYGQIMNIINDNGEAFFQISQIVMKHDKPFPVDHILEVESQSMKNLKIISVKDVLC